MFIVLSVCKIIGIVVLVVLALLAALLFLPVSYEIDADIDQQRYSVKVHWLLRLVRFRFFYGEKAELLLNILFFRFDFLDQEKRRKRKEKKEKKAAKRKKKKKNPEDDQEPEPEKGPFQKVLGILRTVARTGGRALEYDIPDAIWPGLQVFLFRIRPRQVRGTLEFGFSDPATTGQIVGGLAMIPLLYQTDLRILPDFETEQTYISGNFYAKGHMMLFHVVMLLIRWIRQKNVRVFIGAARSAA
ncbi:MAG: DUF2953 domain-containing protein [Clostridiales bacterium]|nr:DUF2953 domain-containing protein [Clostridiales bacterium]